MWVVFVHHQDLTIVYTINIFEIIEKSRKSKLLYTTPRPWRLLLAIMTHLREVGVPSRHTLHTRGVGSESRIRVRRLGGISRAL